MVDLRSPLDREQTHLLVTMAHPYLQNREWPVWQYVQREMDLRNLDATAILRSLPQIGKLAATGPSYGLARFDRNHIGDDSRPALTVAAAVHLPELRMIMGEPFIRVLRVLIELKTNTPVSPQAVTRLPVTSADIRRALPSISIDLLARLPEILNHEPATWGGSSTIDSSDPATWARDLRREILQYRDVRDTMGYVKRVTQLLDVAEPISNNFQMQVADFQMNTVAAVDLPAVVTPVIDEPAPYIDSGLIAELEEKADSTPWKLDKLLQLIAELNSNVASGNAYASHALLRAILDHVPPIFGHGSIEQVASNYGWSQTDKAYMKRLVEFKKTADDVLHRPVRKSAGVISMHDMPPRPYVNAFLRGCVDAL